MPSVLNRALNHLSQRALSLLVETATRSSAFRTSHHMEALPPHLQPYVREGPSTAVIQSYVSLLDTIRILFENILLARILSEVSERELLRDKQFGFRPKHSTSLLLACLFQTVTRNLGEKRLTLAVFLDVAKNFDTIWIEGRLHKLTILNFPSYLLKSISFYLQGRNFEVSFQTAMSSSRGMRARAAHCGLISFFPFSLYVNNMPSPSYHVTLAPYADDTTIIATSRKPVLLVSYLRAYLSDLERWLRE